jgi:deoxyadenosine/deoxycytidine kinase
MGAREHKAMNQAGKEDRRMIMLEGNIGAGKTTIGRMMAASGGFGFIEEPTSMWREGFAANMLQLFYQDPHRWAFTFQICAFNTRAKTWQEVLALNDHSRVVLERSIFSDRFVFAENCYRTGLMSAAEYQLYCGLWDFLASNYCVQPDLVLYLRTPAEVCMERVSGRGRTEETGITLDYLLQLEALHDEWLLEDPRAVVLDGSRRWSLAEMLAEIEPLLSRGQAQTA